jgi:hypothetical protein
MAVGLAVIDVSNRPTACASAAMSQHAHRAARGVAVSATTPMWRDKAGLQVIDVSNRPRLCAMAAMTSGYAWRRGGVGNYAYLAGG